MQPSNVWLVPETETSTHALQVIHHVLRPGGLWLNLGPLLYHWATSDPAPEATWNDPASAGHPSTAGCCSAQQTNRAAHTHAHGGTAPDGSEGQQVPAHAHAHAGAAACCHQAEPEPELSLELPLEDILAVAAKVGFEVLEQDEGEAAYMADVQSLYQTKYTCARWVMRKTGA